MIILHFHLQPQFKYELFHIYFRELLLQRRPGSLELQIQERSVLKCQKKGHMAKVKKKPQKQQKRGRRPDGKQRTHFVEAPIKTRSMTCIICPAIERNHLQWIWNFVDIK